MQKLIITMLCCLLSSYLYAGDNLLKGLKEVVQTSDTSEKAAGNELSTTGLVSMLTGQLGVNNEQAAGGAGAIFSVAKDAMKPENFGLLKEAVPGMEQLLNAAPALGGNSGLLGAATNMLGGGNNSITSMLGPVFQSLGMDSSMVSQFVPIILQYVQTQGGEQLMGMLQQAIGSIG